MKAEDFAFFGRFVKEVVRQAGVVFHHHGDHREGRTRSPAWREKRKKRRKMAQSSRRKNRR
jgi:hypothetical protein